MLIHEERPRPRANERAPVEPDWRVWRWVALAVILGFSGANAGGLVGYLLVCATLAAVCKAATEAVPYSAGLREWRQ